MSTSRNTESGGIDLVAANLLAKVNQLSHSPGKLNEEYPGSQKILMERYGSPTYIVHHSSNIIVTVRGTKNSFSTQKEISETIKQWNTNTDYRPTDFLDTQKGTVHQGFYKAFSSCYQEVEDRLQRYVYEKVGRDPNTKIYFTGHSAGGALATLISF